ncbi:IQ and ubiquitin-like domain-containing protein isoform X1 [Hyla sarda]|uniref:IQ and ubiquitin-like domain-containing protein isoform X1 n=1 Tax=Hyla sarda TaxID=327740 RepID=UPI0024C2BD41|nr:IQ and ubiquitin-like domain-containing protein isoform X1 [Hyla sarda]XP_056429758.1 IQ and ubiquitin-like domain-containing protein isoform X1 [Hyla sarda]XP_056429759.1 IQ and ubiquitin-like domain-containing protein isoform X1 [Hyla sarda]
MENTTVSGSSDVAQQTDTEITSENVEIKQKIPSAVELVQYEAEHLEQDQNLHNGEVQTLDQQLHMEGEETPDMTEDQNMEKKGVGDEELSETVEHNGDSFHQTEQIPDLLQETQPMQESSAQSSILTEEDNQSQEDQDTDLQRISEQTLEKQISSDDSSATATVKVMLTPDGQVITVAFSIGKSIEHLKNYFASQMKLPEAVIRIMYEGRIVEDSETLVDLGIRPHGMIQLDMQSTDPENYPIKAMKFQHEYSMPDVITVRVQTGDESYQDIAVEIERLNYCKPYLGGYRHKVTGVVFHHAGTQTLPKKRPVKDTVVFCRDTQTVFEKNKTQQSRNTMGTQMTKIGCYVKNITDKLIEPKKYVTADEFHARRLKAVITMQTYFRRFHAKGVVQQLREERRLRLEWEEKEELRKIKEKKERLRKEYERRMNPKSKEDFELLYHALELWRKEEVERINQIYTGAERKAALCALLEQETQLISSIGRHKIDAGEENQQKAIQDLLNKCCEPKRWKAFDGKTTEMDTQYTIRARELHNIYNSINTKYFTRDERLDALLTLKHTVKEHDCRLTQEIVELIDREADLLMRGVQNCNLEGLRKRISTLFLQYIKTPTFNPEIARLLKIPEDSTVFRKNIYFCPSCKSYLRSTEFSLSANARTIGRCRKCSKLDNEARQREEFTKYKMLLKQLKKSEADYGDDAKIAFLLQQEDLQYLVENIWGSNSALSACDDLYELVIVRWNKYYEWSPWNCILLTKEEAAAHLNLANADQAYGIVFIRKIKHRHSLAKNYFSQIPEMAPFLHRERSDQMSTVNDLVISKPIAASLQV